MSKGEYYPAVTGEQRKRIVGRFTEQMRKWGLPVPEVEPLVVNFAPHDFEKVGLIEYWIANEEKEGYCGKFLFVFDGQTCPYHHHKQKHETFFVMKGGAAMTVDGKERALKEGDLLAMPQGTRHSFKGIGPALLLEVSKPCLPRDNIFDDKRIGDNGAI